MLQMRRLKIWVWPKGVFHVDESCWDYGPGKMSLAPYPEETQEKGASAAYWGWN